MLSGGVISARRQGTPQGGPLSPLLSNILLDELDKELEGRGHCFCRYADDCTIYVRTKRSGERVMASISRFLEYRLKLQVNIAKSVVARPWQRTFLGYSMTNHRRPRLRVPPEIVARLRAKLKVIFRRGRGRSLSRVIAELTPILRGWMNYFRDIEVKGVLEVLAGWLAAAQAAGFVVAAMETHAHSCAQSDAPRDSRGTRPAIGHQRGRPGGGCW